MDDLVKRLRATKKHTDLEGEVYEVPINPDGIAAADRIEELEAERDKAIRHRDNSNEGYRHTDARAERAEALLKEAADVQAGKSEDWLLEMANRRGVRAKELAAARAAGHREAANDIRATLARMAQEGKE